MQDLTLEVGGVDHVHVDDAEGAHPGGGQVQGGGRAETSGPEQQDLRVEQLQLARLPDLGQEEVALVAVALLGDRVRGADHARPSSFQRLNPPMIEATSV